MKRDRRRSLRLERLEGKALLSAIHALQGVDAPATARLKGGATAGSVAVRGGLVPPTFDGTTHPEQAGLHRIIPLGKTRLMSLSTSAAGGGFGTTSLLAHPGAATGTFATRGLVHGPILVTTRGVAQSTAPVRVAGLGHVSFSFARAAPSGPARVAGGLVDGFTAPPIDTISR